ncbi:MAG: hypothetical protein ACI81R_002880 [Bradymonadia bacterium]|jgi:hypothetical protein
MSSVVNRSLRESSAATQLYTHEGHENFALFDYSQQAVEPAVTC